MNKRAKFLLTICSSMFTLVVKGDPAYVPQIDQRTTKSESAVVEEVIPANYGDYQYRDYIIRWHGNRVVVTNPMCISRHVVGETIPVVVSRSSVDGDQVLRFRNIERYVPRPDDRPPTTDTHESIMDTGTGTVEEVLTAEDESFHFAAYLVKWRDSRIAIVDSAQAHFAAGDSIEFAIAGTSMANNRGVYFFLPKKTQRPTDTTSRESGIIDGVLVAQAEGVYNYRAYLVKWRGAHVVLQDYSAASRRVPGESITFLSERNKEIGESIVGRVRLDPSEQSINGAYRPEYPVKTTQSTDVAVVDEVIEAKVDGIRYVSYFVNWRGQHVAVNDYSATTHYAPKEQISFTATRNSIPSGAYISFDIFGPPIFRSH
jgi:hypothetical protein